MTDDRNTPRADFGTDFDRRLAHQGPGALFTCDADGELRLADDRTREAHATCAEVGETAWRHCLFRDRATGWVQYVLVTAPSLCRDHPRADIRVFVDQAAAFAALDAFGRPPLCRNTW